MRDMPTKQPPMYLPQKKLLQALGERLRLARLRRKLGVDIACERAGISRMTLYRAEAGNSAVALGTIVRILVGPAEWDTPEALAYFRGLLPRRRAAAARGTSPAR